MKDLLNTSAAVVSYRESHQRLIEIGSVPTRPATISGASMGRNLTPKADLGTARAVAVVFVLIACMGWLFLGVGWAWRVSGEILDVGKALALLLVMGPPIIGILACVVLARAGVISVTRRHAVLAGLPTEELEARIGSIAATLGELVSREIERAETAGRDLRAGQAAVQTVADRAREDLLSLSELLARIDSLSKETTSAVARRASALDAAIEGVLRRAVGIFEAIDDRIISRTGQFETRIRDASERLVQVGSRPNAPLRNIAAGPDSIIRAPVAGLKALTDMVTAAACVWGDASPDRENTEMVGCESPSSRRDCARGIVGHPDAMIFEMFDNERHFRDQSETFLKSVRRSGRKCPGSPSWGGGSITDFVFKDWPFVCCDRAVCGAAQMKWICTEPLLWRA